MGAELLDVAVGGGVSVEEAPGIELLRDAASSTVEAVETSYAPCVP